VPYEEFANLNKKTEKNSKSKEFKEKVNKGREYQKDRFKKDLLNAHMKASDIEKHIELDGQTETLLLDYAKKFKLSPRSFNRIKKLARTIADLSDSPTIQIPHILEAFQYRPKMRE
jgi:magnesium chelatase family protein